ncbi:rCG39089 [Rattus norvegicus]|uniref:RCG39089 n=1 Tax=Rattus norvegicus TaxID=10116 RepID=A6JXT2_RAT|nr:rCG39089 [Rattus norvegicus]
MSEGFCRHCEAHTCVNSYVKIFNYVCVLEMIWERKRMPGHVYQKRFLSLAP